MSSAQCVGNVCHSFRAHCVPAWTRSDVQRLCSHPLLGTAASRKGPRISERQEFRRLMHKHEGLTASALLRGAPDAAREEDWTHICVTSFCFSAVRLSISAFCSETASLRRLMLAKAFFSHASCSCASQQITQEACCWMQHLGELSADSLRTPQQSA